METVVGGGEGWVVGETRKGALVHNKYLSALSVGWNFESGHLWH